MPFLSNCHTHSTYCDGKNPLCEMIHAAENLGFVSLGFSGHGMMHFETGYSMSPAAQSAYFHELRSIQQEQGRLRIWAGLELDALAGEEQLKQSIASADYVLGSTHYVLPTPEGEYVAVDGPAQLLKEHMEKHFAGDGLAMAKEYYQVETDFLLHYRPDVIGHFDLIRKNAAIAGLFDENDPAYRKIALDALERAFPCGSILEVNTGGMGRGYLSTPYPTFELLCAWREMGGEATLSSDCHDFNLLTYAFDETLALIRKAGFDHVMRLGSGEKLWEACVPA